MKKNISAAEIYVRAKAQLNLCVRNNTFYIKDGGFWKRLSSSELAVKIRALYTENDQPLISSGSIKEVMERIQQDPKLHIHFLDEDNTDLINIGNGVFNASTGKLENPGDSNFLCRLDFHYISQVNRKSPNFEKFISSLFPEERDTKRQLLLEALGYSLSSYTQGKVAFFFIGASNSGKSTILELLSRLFPADLVTTIPLNRLSNRFNLARLADSRINICTELDENSLSATEIFKQLTAGEVVTAEHKGCKPFDFRLRCKSMNAGNVLPSIKNDGGMPAMLNRMVILIFPVSIAKEKQNLHLLEDLWEERNSIFSNALDALKTLNQNNFCFSEPEDTKRLKAHMMLQGNVLEEFLKDCCVYDADAREHLTTLYEAFIDYCTENLLEVHYSKTAFSQNLARKSQLTHKKFRLNGGKPLAGIVGLRLKNLGEYITQDSEKYSNEEFPTSGDRNTGTSER